MQKVASLLESAVRFQKAGDLIRAEDAYQQVLAAHPLHTRAMHGLARIALKRGDYSAAAQLARQAIDLEPQQADYYPIQAEALRGTGQVAGAIDAYRRALALAPSRTELYCNLGTLLQVQGDLQGARQSYERALAGRADFALAHHNLAVVLQLQGDLDGAANHFKQAAGLNPQAIESQLALGYVLQAQGKHDEARRFFEDAVRRQPDSAAAHCGLGYACQSTGMPYDAVMHYRRAVELAPTYATAHYNLATSLRNLEKRAEALASFQEAVRLDPTMSDAHLGIAVLQFQRGNIAEAADAAQRAAKLTPRSHPAFAQLAAALHRLGDLDGAIAANRRVIEIDPQDAGGHSNLLFALVAHDGCEPESLFAAHRAWGENHAEALTAAAPPHENDRRPDRRLRVGYVSAHFREQAVAFFSEPMIAAHNHDALEVYCYSDVKDPDETTGRFRGYADQWRDVQGLPDETLADWIRADQIDILVDLAGHIGGNRLLTFARKPAPVQVTYLGYQSTTGMSAMDYRLTDEHADPTGDTDRYYTEKLVRLPRAFFCYLPPRDAPEVNALPASTSPRFTFASLNQSFKIRPSTWQAWAAILAAVPDSRLLVVAFSDRQFARDGRDKMVRAGVDPERVEVVPFRPRGEYLQLHHQIDLALDSFPFNGHTTVCDALWMGVPSVMLEGESYASRFGGSALVNVGLDDLVGRTPAQYVEIAVELAGQRQRLAELRRALRGRLRASPLLDAAGFSRSLEEAYRRMWRAWCEPDLASPDQ